jgi:hypothetical protein
MTTRQPQVKKAAQKPSPHIGKIGAAVTKPGLSRNPEVAGALANLARQGKVADRTGTRRDSGQCEYC